MKKLGPQQRQRQQGSALVESLMATVVLLGVSAGVVWVAWLASLRVLLQSLADETASVVAHRSVLDVQQHAPSRGDAGNERLRRDVLDRLRAHPLVPKWMGEQLGLRMTSQSDAAGYVTVQLKLCLPHPESVRQNETSAGPRYRDCLGQFAAGPSTTAGDGAPSSWLGVRGVHPPLASRSIYADGLANLPLAKERARVTRVLIDTGGPGRAKTTP